MDTAAVHVSTQAPIASGNTPTSLHRDTVIYPEWSLETQDRQLTPLYTALKQIMLFLVHSETALPSPLGDHLLAPSETTLPFSLGNRTSLFSRKPHFLVPGTRYSA